MSLKYRASDPHDCASVSPSVRSVSNSVRLSSPTVSHNVRRKWPMSARPTSYHCASLHLGISRRPVPPAGRGWFMALLSIDMTKICRLPRRLRAAAMDPAAATALVDTAPDVFPKVTSGAPRQAGPRAARRLPGPRYRLRGSIRPRSVRGRRGLRSQLEASPHHPRNKSS